MPSTLPQLNTRVEPRIIDLLGRLTESLGSPLAAAPQSRVIALAVELLAYLEGVGPKPKNYTPRKKF
jgi:hypothetical protein